ncbi:MAG: polysaccharide biosynthesis/export family protein [Muribaculaceae bacterium]|nr:polysaccharide biosynthesis/export family protein [Muribaculaceae bacterium]
MKSRFMYLVVCLAVMLSACSTSKNSLTYFEDIQGIESGSVPSTEYSVKIIPNDELFITVTSLIPQATAVYNLPISNPGILEVLNVTTQPQQQTFIVDKAGDIDFPLVGKVHVEGLTTQQIKEKLVELIGKDVDDPIVRVELMNFRVNVLGEVKKPGAVSVRRERYSVLDALADAGDLTEFGERSNVLLIREENGAKTYHRLNLNEASTLSSPYFYMQQNDVIYVEPNEIRKDNSKYNQNNAFKLSVISTIVSACSVIASLVIALTVK